MTDESNKVDPLDEPITAGGILDAAIAIYDLPPRDGKSAADWIASLAGDSAQGFGRELVRAASVADFHTAKLFALQAETAHLAGRGEPKKPDRS